MAKKFVKRTDANNETLYFYTHSDVVDVGEGNATTSLTNALNNKANTSDVQALSDDALRKSPQSLSSQEKSQVHNNIGTESFVDDRAVRYDDAQVLGSEEKTQALTNLGLNGVDDEPTPNSDNLVKSGGVQNELALGAVYDVSAKNPTAGSNNDGKFESLSALLSDANINTLIPIAVRKGGMSIKFVQSSDDKYVQKRLMNTTFSVIPGNWQDVVDSQLEIKLQGITAEETKVVLAENSNWYDGKYVTTDGKIKKGSTPSGGVPNGVLIINVSGCKKVRFLGYLSISPSGAGYGFSANAIDPTSTEVQLTNVTEYRGDGQEVSSLEYLVDVPDGMNYFACTIRKYGTPQTAVMTINDFYCYTQSGYPAASTFKTGEFVGDFGVDDIPAYNDNLVKNKALWNVIEDYSSVLTTYVKTYYAVLSDGTFGTSTTYNHAVIPVIPNSRFIIYNDQNSNEINSYVRYAFATSPKATPGDAIPMVEGTSVGIVPIGEACIITIPESCSHLLVNYHRTYPLHVRLYGAIGTLQPLFNTGIPTSFAVQKTLREAICIRKISPLHLSELSIDIINLKVVANQSTQSTYILKYFKITKGQIIHIHGEEVEGTTRGVRYALSEQFPEIGVDLIYAGAYTTNYDRTIISPLDGYFLYLTSMVGFTNSYIETTSDAASNFIANYISTNSEKLDVSELLRDGVIPFYQTQYVLNSEGIWMSTSSYFKWTIINVEGIKKVSMTTQNSENGYFALLKSFEPATEGGLPTSEYCAGYNNRVQYQNTIEVELPYDCNYLYIAYGNNDKTLPLSVILYKRTENSNSDYFNYFNKRVQNEDMETLGNSVTYAVVEDENGWEVPTSIQMINLTKKVDQMANIQWTPKLSTIPESSSSTTPDYYPVSQQTGLPYSGNMARTVGMGVSYETFMTAVNNKYSLMYTEDLKKPVSAWGEGVPHKPTNGHCRSWYGVYCNSFAAFVHGYDMPITCSEFEFISKQYHDCSMVYAPFEKDSFRQGDILSNASPAHTRIVLNVKRDSEKHVTALTIAEATGNVNPGRVRIITYSDTSSTTLANYIASMKSAGYKHFRNIKLYRNVDYEPSQFIAVGNETPIPYIYNNDVCTFAGNKASFLTDQTVVINFNLNDESNWPYTELKLYKGTTLIHTQDISQIDSSEYPTSPVTQSGHAWKIPNQLISSSGLYKVCASDGVNESEFTLFEVIDDTCTIERIDNDVFDISYSGQNEVCAFYIQAVNYIWIPLTDLEKSEKKIRIYPKRMFEYNGMTFDYNTTVIAWYIKGEYGKVRTEFYNLISN